MLRWECWIIEPVDRDMRYMHVAIRKNITERYRKVGFMEKYGVMVFSGIFINCYDNCFMVDAGSNWGVNRTGSNSN